MHYKKAKYKSLNPHPWSVAHRPFAIGLLKFIAVLVLIVSSSFSVTAQPCLSNWSYRVPVTINNPGSVETDLPVSVAINTQNLVISGKIRFDGADLRVLDASGNSLPFWFDPAEMNTSSTTVWIKLSNLPSGSTTIYLFYGYSSAQSLSDGEATFTLFDTFDEVALNTSKWSKCGASSVSLESGKLKIANPSASEQLTLIRSVSAFPTDVVVEANVSSLSGTGAFVGMVSSSDEGYALYYDNGSQTTMKLQVITSPGTCLDLADQTPTANRVNAVNAIGSWSARWPATAQQYIDWPGASSHPVSRNDATHSLPANYDAIIGLEGALSSVSFDWVRVRKYPGSTVTSSLGSEDVISINASITTNAPLCEGGDLSLSVTNFDGATYSWTGPDGFTATGQYIEINNVSSGDSGLYEVTITGSGGCGVITALEEVNIYAETNKGSVSGAAMQCAESNGGTVQLSGIAGDVVRWESSVSGKEPWNTISSEKTTLSYENLTTTTWYRAVIKNGTCESKMSDSVKITVFEKSNGGYIIGASDVCAGENENNLTAFGYTGSILSWEYSGDDFTTVTTINSVNDKITIEDIDETVEVRAIVQNGVCPQVYSLSSTIKVNPLPVPDFVVDTACNGLQSNFVNLSSISEGIIASYSWNFGDGASSVNEEPVHTYVNDGIYQVQLLAISGKNCLDSVKKNVRVKPLPIPQLSFEDACEDIAVPFDNSSYINSGSISAYSWSFGDGSTSSSLEPDHTYTDAGQYEVKLILESSEGCFDSLSQTINIYGRSSVSFSADSVCDGIPMQFVNNSTSSAGNLTFTWDFGDGTTSTSLNPGHLYDNPGSYRVTLTANSTSSCTDSFNKTINVNPQPVAEFTTQNICLNDTAVFTNSTSITEGQVNYNWTFGDGNFSFERSPKYKYSSPGTYQVTLTARSAKGCTDDLSAALEVYDQPSAKFVVEPVCLGENSVFQNLSETGTQGAAYEWSFGDGSISSETSPYHSYNTNGIYEVRLIATTDVGCKDTLYNKAQVWALPEPDFVADAVCDEFPTIFINQSSIPEGEIKSFSWDFGDGTNSVQTAPVKQYLNAGSYNVRLQAISSNGCENVFERNVLVKETPIANFSFANVCEGNPVQFENTSQFSGGQLQYAWKFGNGSASSERSPTYTFDQPGSYPVQLKVEANQCSDSITKVVSTYEAPFSSISNDTTISKGFGVQLQANGGTKYFWEPISGLNNSDVSNPVASPTETTTYTAYIIDGNGCRVMQLVTVNVVDDYIVSPSNVLTPDGNGQNDTWKVTNIENYPDNEVFIYNRWGQEVFSATGYENDWGGLSGTDLLPDGTYYYLILFKDQGIKYSGALTILRNR